MEKAEKPPVEIKAFLRDGVPTVHVEDIRVEYISCEREPLHVQTAIGPLHTADDFFFTGEIVNALYKAQSAIVHCRECKHWFDDGVDFAGSTKELASCNCDALLRRKDFFCANGERRTEAANEQD